MFKNIRPGYFSLLYVHSQGGHFNKIAMEDEETVKRGPRKQVKAPLFYKLSCCADRCVSFGTLEKRLSVNVASSLCCQRAVRTTLISGPSLPSFKYFIIPIYRVRAACRGLVTMVLIGDD